MSTIGIDLSIQANPALVAVSIPGPVTNLVVTPNDGSVELTWDATPTATGYQIARSATAASPAYLTTVLATLAYSDHAVTNESQYHYNVKAQNAAGHGVPTAIFDALPSKQILLNDQFFVII